MKTQTFNLFERNQMGVIGRLLGLFLLLTNATFISSAQEIIYKEKPRTITKQNVSKIDEKALRKNMEGEGEMSSAVIEKIMEQRRKLILSGRNVTWTHVKNAGNTPVPFAACNNMGGENGWGAWMGVEGIKYRIPAGSLPVYNAPLAPVFPRFNLTSGLGNDPCTPGTNPGDPLIPVVAPGFGNASIQIGEPQVNGNAGGCSPVLQAGCAEQLTYPLVINTLQEANFIYTYAAILFDPDGGSNAHVLAEKPYVEFVILTAQGDTVDCSHQFYTSNPNPGSGWYRANGACFGAPDTWYKPWSIVGIDLTNYIGQNLTAIITNVDCAQGGHYAHSYWDFSCGSVTSEIAYCPGQSISVCAQASPDPVNNPYTYVWSQNTNPYTGPPVPYGGNTQCITPIPQAGDTFFVEIIQPSGCNLKMNYTVSPNFLTPVFTSTGTCGQMSFSDQSTSSNPSVPITSWNWQFPGGTPSSSTSQNPGTVMYPPGTYTATLTVSTAAGCPSTITHVFTVGGFPTPAFSSTPPCLGGSTQLTDMSLPSAGDPIASWNWQMPGGTPATSTSQNPSTTYSTPGAHTVTLSIVSQQGCPGTITQQVLVYSPPVANFGNPIADCAPVCNNYADLSQPVDGTLTNWQWSFPGGTPSSSTTQNPQNICYYTPGSYGASVIVTNSYGCKDTINLPMVEVYPWPTADFCVTPLIAPTTNPVFNFCDMWSSDVVSWTWNFGDNDSDFVNTDPVHSYSATANQNDFYAYNICIRVLNQYGCWDTICKVVELVPEFTFYIPNTFTPNGDWMNEMFFGKSRGVKEYNIWLFDRWGNQIWDCHREDKNTNWDSDVTIPKQEGLSSYCQWDGVVISGGMDMGGNSKQLAQEDVYVWKVRLTDIFDKKHLYIGHVSIVR